MFMRNGFIALVFSVLIFQLASCIEEPEPVAYYDHVEPYEIVDETFRLGARSTALFSNKSIIYRTIQLPPRTVYWAYWMGAGPEPLEELASVVIPAAASHLTTDPFVAYAWGIIGSLNLVNYGTQNADLFFLETSQRNYFSFDNWDFSSFIAKPQTINIHEKYIDILDTPMDESRSITVGLRNQSYTSGVDVTLKIWAFVVKPL